MSKGHIVVQKTDGKYIISLVGPLDEHISFRDAIIEDAQEVVLNFEKVSGIKSFGIRELIRWLNAYKSSKVIYMKCPKIVVDQMNIVDGFLPKNGVVESFYVPYYSEETSEETQVLFRYGVEFTGSNITPPPTILDSKGNPMEMDVIWNKYFRFLESKDRKRSA